jgi:hypothetical protein
MLTALGIIAAGELISAWEAVRLAEDTLEARSLAGGSWFTGDGSPVSRGRGLESLGTRSLLWGLPLAATTFYGMRLCAWAVRSLAAGPRGS